MDPPFRKGALSPTKLAELLQLPESEQALLRKTEEDFYNESLEVRQLFMRYLVSGRAAAAA